jgi:ComF family protein
MTVFCRSCSVTLVRSEPGASLDVAPFVYGGALAAAIVSLKYAGRVDRARPLSHLLLGALGPLRACPPTLVVPVPLHPRRARERGFNQAALLARPVARALHVRLDPVLVRCVDTAMQASLDRAERLRNVARAFEATASLRGERLLLVDDVRTTGATLEACRVAALAAGAEDVRTLVLAAAER